ncbi:uncharacterized protein B0I36DRAFT_82808 [Microdochium trichocladiopsis]|uniref:MARVEL domain-containing protein n=1 Tax=Microdochium trichocladiopsis TaxID=1682393 RepID=A0A9P9BW26_9PEZI|nr:uncharacterized protein B0I36DRAFT_82808 [Microdochium trichocladiopsis]KAH7034651.1 hypothetical protein B0I36DRAFT_82808 [Microdochium trichocladiopsis]
MQQPVNQPAAAQPAPVTMIVPKYSADREPGMEHIPRHPKGFVAIRIIQLLFCVICIGLSGYILAVAAFPAAGFMIFVCVVTLIMSIYNIVALTKAHKLYNYWAVLAFEIFLFIFWLVAFAYMAATAAIVLAYWATYADYYDYYYSYSYGDAYKALGAIMGAAAGIGALTWILYFISLVMNSVFISRHRSVGLHNTPGATTAAPVAAAAAPAAGEKVEMRPQQPGQIYPQASGYSQAAPAYGAGAMPPQQGFYPQPSMSPPPQQMSPPPQQFQQYPPQQYPQHSGQAGYPPQPQGQYPVSSPSVDGSYNQSMPAQTTGGSYVQGNPVAFPNSHSAAEQQPGAPVHEAHGQSYDPHAPKEMQS